MQLHDLLGGVDVAERVGDPRVEVTAIAHDSRRVAPGALFCCVRGATSDGHDHAADAVGAGSVALLVERVLRLPVPQVRVSSVREALGPVAAAFFGFPSRSLRVLGVTGTDGKTTTVHLLGAIAAAAGQHVGLVGTLGAQIGRVELAGERTTPEATELQALLAAMRDRPVQTVAMEVSSHALAQHRVDGTRFAAACFTNLSREHLDYHGDLGEYLDAKARLFTREFTDTAAVNRDDEYGPEVTRRSRRAGLTVHTFSAEGPADVWARDVRLDATGRPTFVLDATGWGESAPVSVPLLGRFNVANSLGAATTALGAGMEFGAVVSGLSQVSTVPGRAERLEAGQPFTVLVDYAHTPRALEVVLELARTLAGREHQVIVVFGCGGDRDAEKRPAMGRVAARGADQVIVTSDNPRSEEPAAIARAVLGGIGDGAAGVTVELDRRAAIGRGLDAARRGDVVVIAGKGHEQGQTAEGVTTPFDDRAVARAELEGRRCSS